MPEPAADAVPPHRSPAGVAGLFSLAGRVAVVTGGSRGLGKEMARALAEAGARVAITARREQWLAPAAAELAQAGHDCFAAPCDVSSPDDVQRFVQQTLDRFGRIDVLFNNAGVSWAAPTEDMPLERWRAVLDVNATGAFLVAQAVGRHMIDRARAGQSPEGPPGPDGPPGPAVAGKIVNVSSLMGLRGLPPEQVTAIGYSASKGALIALTRALAVEWAPHGITVNALAPGFFPTRLSEGVIAAHEPAMLERIPLRRFGSEQDIRALAVFLAAPASDYLTGQVISLDGGATAL